MSNECIDIDRKFNDTYLQNIGRIKWPLSNQIRHHRTSQKHTWSLGLFYRLDTLGFQPKPNHTWYGRVKHTSESTKINKQAGNVHQIRKDASGSGDDGLDSEGKTRKTHRRKQSKMYEANEAQRFRTLRSFNVRLISDDEIMMILRYLMVNQSDPTINPIRGESWQESRRTGRASQTMGMARGTSSSIINHPSINQQTRHSQINKQDIHTHIKTYTHTSINPQDCLLPYAMPCHWKNHGRRPAPAGRIPLEGVLICLGFFFFGLRGAQGEPLNASF